VFVVRRITNDEEVSVASTTEANIALDPRVSELVALAAAVGSNCEACFRSHHEAARTLGLSTEEIVHAVRVAQGVKDTPARRMLDLAARKLGVPADSFASSVAVAEVIEDETEPVAETKCC
jgi:AhpD family alkylhydroperoxidase